MKIRSLVVALLVAASAGNIYSAPARNKQPGCDKMIGGTTEQSFVQRLGCSKQALRANNLAKAYELMAPIYKHATAGKKGGITVGDSQNKLGDIAVLRLQLDGASETAVRALINKHGANNVYAAVAVEDGIDPLTGKKITARKEGKLGLDNDLVTSVRGMMSGRFIGEGDVIRRPGAQAGTSVLEGTPVARPTAPSRPAPTRPVVSAPGVSVGAAPGVIVEEEEEFIGPLRAPYGEGAVQEYRKRLAKVADLPMKKTKATDADEQAVVDLRKAEILEFSINTTLNSIFMQALADGQLGLCNALIQALKLGDARDLNLLARAVNIAQQDGSNKAIADLMYQGTAGWIFAGWRQADFTKQPLQGRELFTQWISFTPSLSVTQALRQKGALQGSFVDLAGNYVTGEGKVGLVGRFTVTDVIAQLRTANVLLQSEMSDADKLVLTGIKTSLQKTLLNDAGNFLSWAKIGDLREQLKQSKTKIASFASKEVVKTAAPAPTATKAEKVGWSSYKTAMYVSVGVVGFSAAALGVLYLGRNTPYIKPAYDAMTAGAVGFSGYITDKGKSLLGYLGGYTQSIRSLSMPNLPAWQTVQAAAGTTLTLASSATALVAGVKALQARNYSQAALSTLLLISTGGSAYNSLASGFNILNQQGRGYLAARALGDGLQKLKESGEEALALQEIIQEGLNAEIEPEATMAFAQGLRSLSESLEGAEAARAIFEKLSDVTNQVAAAQAGEAMRLGVSTMMNAGGQGLDMKMLANAQTAMQQTTTQAERDAVSNFRRIDQQAKQEARAEAERDREEATAKEARESEEERLQQSGYYGFPEFGGI